MSYLGQTVIPRTRINTALLGKETQRRYLERVHYEHEEIYKAIRLQNSLVASSAMQMHLNNSAERLRSTLNN
jgi:DNA-binding FadR family transcriptional regulator